MGSNPTGRTIVISSKELCGYKMFAALGHYIGPGPQGSVLEGKFPELPELLTNDDRFELFFKPGAARGRLSSLKEGDDLLVERDGEVLNRLRYLGETRSPDQYGEEFDNLKFRAYPAGTRY